MLLSMELGAKLLRLNGSEQLGEVAQLQPLWGNYGELLRVHFTDGRYSSLIVKHIRLPKPQHHPRGWNSDRSHQRKLTSYQVEAAWYQRLAKRSGKHAPLPRCLHLERSDKQIVLVLEDLALHGYSEQVTRPTAFQIKRGIRWLAHFHATYLQQEPTGLWQQGCYWHLATRPDEWRAMPDSALKRAAAQIDQQLEQCRYHTLLHGDAKLANFLFRPEDGAVAAVDFQYVGRGCGMKDLSYFIGSCVPEEECAALEEELLEYYFSELKHALVMQHSDIDGAALEQEWRQHYALAWADFQRFLVGWCPDHWKINSYGNSMVARALQQLNAKAKVKQ